MDNLLEAKVVGVLLSFGRVCGRLCLYLKIGWRDKWLPTPSSICIQCLVKSLQNTSLVSDLIDLENSSWKIDLIKNEF